MSEQASAKLGEPRVETPLRQQLRLLSQGKGIWRADSDLAAFLAAETSDLVRFWSIDLAQKPVSLRGQLRAALSSHFRSIPLSPGFKSHKAFELAFNAGFNLSTDPGNSRVDLGKRQRSLDRLSLPKNLRLSPSTAQRYLAYAIVEIEKQILATGFVPRAAPGIEGSVNGKQNNRRLCRVRKTRQGKSWLKAVPVTVFPRKRHAPFGCFSSAKVFAWRWL